MAVLVGNLYMINGFSIEKIAYFYVYFDTRTGCTAGSV